MNNETTFILIVTSLVVVCLASVGAKALREFSRQKLGHICRGKKNNTRFRDILRFHNRAALGVETLQVLATAALVCASTYWIFGRQEDSGGPTWTTLLAAFGLGGLLLLAVEVWLPLAIAKLWAEPFLYHTWRVWNVVGRLLSPLVAAANFIDALFHRLADRPREELSEEYIEEEIRAIVSEGHREGVLERDAREMIEGVIELGDADVSEIMTPRTDMVSMAKPRDLDEALDFVVTCSHTRIPVFGRNRDDIVGILYAKDLLPELAKKDEADRKPIAKILRKPHFVPQSKRVDDLLEEFQLTRNHMAIVLDEYGGVSGLVTIEDVLEEIVGEIVDEYDDELDEGIKRIDQSTAEVLGKVRIDEINDRFGLSIDEEGEFDTIGGFVFHELGRVPKVGEQLNWETVLLTVLDATPRRINRLKLEILDVVSRESA